MPLEQVPLEQVAPLEQVPLEQVPREAGAKPGAPSRCRAPACSAWIQAIMGLQG